MKIGAIILGLLMLDACRDAPRAPVPKAKKEHAKTTPTPKNDQCAQFPYGICPTEVKPDKNSEDSGGVPAETDNGNDLSPPTIGARASFAGTPDKQVKVIVDGQPIDNDDITLSGLTIIPDRNATLTADGTSYTLSLTVNAEFSKNNSEHCASGQLTTDDFEDDNTDKKLKISEGACP